MDVYNVLRALPLASAAVWFSLAGFLWIPVFNETAFLIILLYIAAYSIGGIINLYRLHRIVRNTSPQLSRRTRGFLIVFALTIVLGLGTNGALGAIRSQIPPPFS